MQITKYDCIARRRREFFWRARARTRASAVFFTFDSRTHLRDCPAPGRQTVIKNKYNQVALLPAAGANFFASTRVRARAHARASAAFFFFVSTCARARADGAVLQISKYDCIARRRREFFWRARARTRAIDPRRGGRRGINHEKLICCIARRRREFFWASTRTRTRAHARASAVFFFLL